LLTGIQARKQGFEPQQAGLYRQLLGVEGVDVNDFAAWCKVGCEAFDSTQWEAEISQSGEVLRLLLELRNSNVQAELGPSYKDALVQHAKKVLAGEVRVDKDTASRWPKVLEPLGDGGTRIDLAQRVLCATLENDGNVPECFLGMYGAELSRPEILLDTPRVISNLFSPIVGRREIHSLDWLKGVTEKQRRFLKEYKNQSEVEDFTDRLRECLAKGGSAEPQALITAIARNLGLKKRRGALLLGDWQRGH
jgi:hypothetical protein